jgi:histidinol-phosphate phosphatase family protein
MTGDYTVVIPTTGRANLTALLSALAGGAGSRPAEVIVVDDRADGPPLSMPPLPVPARVVRSGGRGPAAARNTGWRLASTEWVAFLDDDVLVSPTWARDLARDLDVGPSVAASQARIVVPVGARPTDDERGTVGLETARWITADMAYRRPVLSEVDGFDERFPRAFREDSDLALRVLAAGYEIVTGSRTTTHPAARGDFLASVRRQAGNADNALMRRKHGRDWRRRAAAGSGMLGRHAVTTASAAAAVLLARPRRTRLLAGAAALAWAGLTGAFAWRRIRPGPRTAHEVTRMVVTSAVIPPAACAHRLAGEVRVRRRVPSDHLLLRQVRVATLALALMWHRIRPRRGRTRPAAVLFDRDDTLIVDVPYLDDPAGVRPVPGAEEVLRGLRAAGVRVGVVSNQSGVARGLISPARLAAVNARVEELLGPFDTWQVCVHGEEDGCACRKPAPGLVRRAAEALDVDPRRCVVIGDTGADVDAARAAGARGVLVPTTRTRPEEVHRAELVANSLVEAVGLVMTEGEKP